MKDVTKRDIHMKFALCFVLVAASLAVVNSNCYQWVYVVACYDSSTNYYYVGADTAESYSTNTSLGAY